MRESRVCSENPIQLTRARSRYDHTAAGRHLERAHHLDIVLKLKQAGHNSTIVSKVARPVIACCPPRTVLVFDTSKDAHRPLPRATARPLPSISQ